MVGLKNLKKKKHGGDRKYKVSRRPKSARGKPAVNLVVDISASEPRVSTIFSFPSTNWTILILSA